MITLCHKKRKKYHKMELTDKKTITAAGSGAENVPNVTSTAKKGELKKCTKKNIMIPRMQTQKVIDLVFPGRQFLKEREPSPNWLSTKVKKSIHRTP